MRGKNKAKIIYLLLASCLCVTAAAASAGSSQDPLISLSYIKNTYLPGMTKKIEASVGAAYDALLAKVYAKAEQKKIDKIADFYLAAIGKASAVNQSFSDVRMYKGDVMRVSAGTKFVLKSGAAKLSGAGSSEFIDITAGKAIKINNAVSANREYLAADNGCTVQSSDYYTTVSVKGEYSVVRAYTAKNGSIADGLKQMGLFLGTGTGYDLERPATRMESLVMLIRLLGQENAALSCADKNPFTDVPAWADRYAAYAYAKGYTKGTSAALFSPNTEVTDEQYLTFVLRSLGYSDSAGEFAWNNASAFAAEKAVITKAEESSFKNAVFRRDQVVYISRNALYAKLKSGAERLVDSLISGGAVSSENLKKAEAINGFSK